MITYTDVEFQATKRIVLGLDSLAHTMHEIANWVADRYSVRVVNAIHDPAGDLLRKPRLQIILEHAAQAERFRDGANFDAAKQREIAEQFAEIVNRNASHHDCDGMFVVFSAFAPIANEEADSKITDAEVENLKHNLGDSELWEISRCFGHVTFMFFTDKQAKLKTTDGTLNLYTGKYFDVLKPFDEFDYLDRSKYSVKFDSKQNLDENYNGNWFYYYR